MHTLNVNNEKEISFYLIRDTFRQCFDIELDEKYWSWRFKDNPFPEEGQYLSYILQDNVLAAYYAVSPVLITIKNTIYKVALSNMTMTHPDYQGQGLFTIVAKSLYDRLKEKGFVGVFGFANHNSHYGFKKHLNWKDLQPVNTFSLEAARFRNFLLKEKNEFSFQVKMCTTSDINELKKMEFSKQPITLTRSKEFLDWRLVRNPANKYSILKINKGGRKEGYIVFKFYGDEIDIMEYFYSKGAHSETILYGIDYLLNGEVEKINMWSNFHTEEHMILEKYGFEETVFNSYFGVIPFTDDIDLNYKNWHIRFMDSDIF